ncbi:MAG: hypothetical protein GYA39_03600 [Methanothrix sp.]|nr:hypothetical protein [Methanothrix sp.]
MERSHPAKISLLWRDPVLQRSPSCGEIPSCEDLPAWIQTYELGPDCITFGPD